MKAAPSRDVNGNKSMRLSTVIGGIAAAGMTTLVAGQALAQQALEIIGQPVQGGMGFQPSATELKHDIVWLDTMINYIIGAIVRAEDVAGRMTRIVSTLRAFWTALAERDGACAEEIMRADGEHWLADLSPRFTRRTEADI